MPSTGGFPAQKPTRRHRVGPCPRPRGGAAGLEPTLLCRAPGVSLKFNESDGGIGEAALPPNQGPRKGNSMKSRMVQQVASLSLVLALASPLAGSAAPRKPQALDHSGGVISFFISMWETLAPSWAKSRGTMDPDGVEPGPTPPADPTPTINGDETRSRGTMDPDGWLVV